MKEVEEGLVVVLGRMIAFDLEGVARIAHLVGLAFVGFEVVV